jgi:HSP20 family molecular chaperone IbpA
MLRVTCSSPDPMEEGRRETVDQSFRRYYPKGMPVMTAWAPAMEVTAREGKLTVRCDVPGVEPSDIRVAITGRTLTISGERKAPAPSDDHWVGGISYGTFTRTFTLPDGFDGSAAIAKHRHGVLEMELSLAKTNAERTVPIVAKNKESDTSESPH